MLNDMLNNDIIEYEMNKEIYDIIKKCKISNNMKLLIKYIKNKAKDKGKDLSVWESKHNNLEDICKWFNCKSDIDRFIDKI